MFDKYTGKLIGFTSLGDPELDFATFEELQLATHVLAFMIRGVQTTLSILFDSNNCVISACIDILACCSNFGVEL